METKKPHIIIFNPDEMRKDSLQHMGCNPAAITPNFDQFAEQDAVSFSNAYCQNPVCVPSRCSFFTGLYPHTTGHRTMSYLLRPGETSLFKELKDSGYHVWMNNRNDLCAGQYPGWLEEHMDEIFYPEKSTASPGCVNPNIKGEEGGKYFYSHFEGQLKTDENGINLNADDETVEAAIHRINEGKEGDQPLCMFLGLFYPHPPYQVENPYFSAIDRNKLPKRIDFNECSGKSEMMMSYHNYQNLEGLTEEEWDELRATYAGMCMKIDHQFGELVNALKEAGIYEDCAIFVISDHGDFAGDYGMAEKAQSCFEDCLTNVPFLVKPPKDVKVDAGISHAMVELVDFYATAMDFAGVKPTHEHFGKSLRDAVQDRKVKVRDYAFCEGGRLSGETHCDEYHDQNGKEARKQDVYWPKKKAQADDYAHAKATMIRNEKYKYISRITGEDEFYDLERDPNETVNQINNKAYADQIITFKNEMLKWMQSTSDIVPYDFDRRMTETMLWNLVKNIAPACCEEDVRQKIKGGMGIGEILGYCYGLARNYKKS